MNRVEKTIHQELFMKSIRVNMIVEGEPAEWLQEWKSRELVTSYTDARTAGTKMTKP